MNEKKRILHVVGLVCVLIFIVAVGMCICPRGKQPRNDPNTNNYIKNIKREQQLSIERIEKCGSRVDDIKKRIETSTERIGTSEQRINNSKEKLKRSINSLEENERIFRELLQES